MNTFVSTSHTNKSIHLALPFAAIYPVAANYLLGCNENETISSICLIKKSYFPPSLFSYLTTTAAAGYTILLKSVE